ncbi:S-adenosyl-L-methionine-dependent methyltransferase [Gongronella butleri]|nr:S-adenosyl-L-methionine-dependent methyltransferase [Gongronella butleri]
MPCDADETDRLIVMHYLLKHALQHNFIAPVHAVLNQGDYDPHERATVLDIGAGAGTWIMEMASEFRSADFHGIDIANMYPSTIKPTNAHFQHHDVLCGTLPFDDETFDYVYMRQMLPGMTKEQLHNVLSEILRVLKPNGYVEIVDAEFAIQRAGPVTQSLMNTHCKRKKNRKRKECK